MVQIHALKLESELNEDVYQLLVSKTSAEKKNKIQKFARRADALRCLFADLLTRYTLVQNFGLENEDISFTYSSYGKPFLEGRENIYFNVSHSGDWVVCATDEKPVGVDIEYIAPVDLQIAETYFSKNEKEQLFALEESEQLQFFYELWTLKESYLKLRGEGLSIPLNTFSISIDQKRNIDLKCGTEAPGTIFFKQYDLDTRYKTAACAFSNTFENMVSLSMQEIMAFFNAW